MAWMGGDGKMKDVPGDAAAGRKTPRVPDADGLTNCLHQIFNDFESEAGSQPKAALLL
jgi:hypothetical protein